MKIAYIVDTFPRDSEMFIRREVEELKRRGVEMRIFSICRPPNEDPAAVYLENTHWDIGSLVRPAKILAGLLDRTPRVLAGRLRRMPQINSLIEQISRDRFDILHAHFLGIASTFALVATRTTGVPLTISAHGRDIYCSGEAVLRKARHTKAIFACCRSHVDRLVRIGVPEHKVHLSYHGTAAASGPKSSKKGSKKKTPSIVCAGRFVEKKGFEYLMDALKILKLEKIPFRCTICGDGPLKGKLMELARLSGLGQTIDFRGWVPPDSMRDIYAAANVAVCPSVTARDGDRDGVPNVILEAMASGVPVVASDSGGVPEAVIDGSTGILVPQRDSTALADGIARILKDKALRGSLVRGAKKHLEQRFDLSKNIDVILNVWGRGQTHSTARFARR